MTLIPVEGALAPPDGSSPPSAPLRWILAGFTSQSSHRSRAESCEMMPRPRGHSVACMNFVEPVRGKRTKAVDPLSHVVELAVSVHVRQHLDRPPCLPDIAARDVSVLTCGDLEELVGDRPTNI